jgi:hypothetical protein
MPKRPADNKVSTAVGVSTGTGLSGLVLLMPDGTLKSILLILCPTVTVVASGLWRVVNLELEAAVADWRIRSQKRKAIELLKRLNADAQPNQEMIQIAQDNVTALTRIEVEITRKRVEAIIEA